MRSSFPLTVARMAATLSLFALPALPVLAAEAVMGSAQAVTTTSSGTIERIDLARAELFLGGQRYGWDAQRPRAVLGGAGSNMASLQAGQWITLQWEPGAGSARRIRTIVVAAVR